MRGESPTASHLLYTQPGVLDDDIPSERKLGIDAGLAWRDAAQATVVYVDRGISGGMKYGIGKAQACGRPVEYRKLAAARNPDPGQRPRDAGGIDPVGDHPLGV